MEFVDPSSHPSPSRLPDSVPSSPSSTVDRSASTIFCSIISYRDPETWPTIHSLFSCAAHPSRVHIGVVWQFEAVEDESFVYPAQLSPSSSSSSPTTPIVYSANIRQLFLPHTAARGPLYARHLCRRLYSSQQFVLQLDSHMRFTAGWDVQLIDQLYTAAAHSSQPLHRLILTGYPSSYQVDDKPSTRPLTPSVQVMAASHFADDGLLRIKGIPLRTSPPSPSPSSAPSVRAPLPSLFISAGFVFSCSFWYCLPPIPPSSFPFLFFGEELLLSVHAFSHGLLSFHCSPHVAVHCWDRSYRKGWREVVGKRGEGEEEGMRRVSRIMRGEEEGEGWMGKERRVKEYWDWVGVDWHAMTISGKAKTGGMDESWLAGRQQGTGAGAGVGLTDALLQRVMAFAALKPNAEVKASAKSEEKRKREQRGDLGGENDDTG